MLIGSTHHIFNFALYSNRLDKPAAAKPSTPQNEDPSAVCQRELQSQQCLTIRLLNGRCFNEVNTKAIKSDIKLTVKYEPA